MPRFIEKAYLCNMNHEYSCSDVSKLLRIRPCDAHKGSMGHSLLIAGSQGIAGCAVLAAEACLRSGVGKLTVATPECNRLVLQISVPEAIVHVGGHLNCSQYQSIGIGPGTGNSTAAMLTDCLESSCPIVVDADALHALAEHPSMLHKLHSRAILTPHVGEMRHLIQGLHLEGDSLLHQASTLAMKAGVVVVLKGHPSHVCLPTGEILDCPRGNAGMATAGSGDVLTGILTGLLAQGYAMEEAALLGVWLHASAGDFAAHELVEESLLARDIIRHLPEAFREIHENVDNNLK